MVDSGEARTAVRKVAVTHAGGRRYISRGSASATTSTPSSAPPGRRRGAGPREGARHPRAVLGGAAPRRCPGFVEGTLLAAYEYRAYKSADDDGPRLEELIVSAHHDIAAEVERRAVVAEAANAIATCRTRRPTR